MAKYDNECIPFYRPGSDLTAQVGTAVTGKTFVAISANRQSGPALANTANGGNIVIAPCAANLRAFGVAVYDSPVGDKVPIITTGAVVPVTADGAITAGVDIIVGLNGKAKAQPATATGVAVGVALSAAVDGAEAQVKLF